MRISARRPLFLRAAMVFCAPLAPLLAGCATGLEAHDGTLRQMTVELRVRPYPEVRDYCRPLIGNTEAMGCATKREDGADNSKPAIAVGGNVVISAGFDCRITVSPSVRLLAHELARCEGSSVYVSLPVTRN